MTAWPAVRVSGPGLWWAGLLGLAGLACGAASPSPSPGCVDVANWNVSGGLTCADFVDNAYCTPTRGYGTGWNSLWGTFSLYTYHGLDCTQACCGCGKAYMAPSPSVSPSPASDSPSPSLMASPAASPITCLDIPACWMDSANHTCAEYSSLQWCNFAGGYGTGWQSSWGTFS
eukprot:EG_transcript_27949